MTHSEALKHQSLISPIHWGHRDPQIRGPVIQRSGNGWQSNVAGAHLHSAWQGLSAATGALSPSHRPDFNFTTPKQEIIRPNEGWFDPNTIVTLDPFGHQVSELFKRHMDDGANIMPTIAMTTAKLTIPEVKLDLKDGHLYADGNVLNSDGEIAVTKIYIDPVWYIPGIANRLHVDENVLRKAMSDYSNGMYGRLVNNPETNVLLPSIPGTTLYIFGDPQKLWDPTTHIASRPHDECNSSDVFGSDICTCRPYLMHGVSVCIQAAQAGGVGIITYNHKEARNLGTVVKYLVYQARGNDPQGDRPEDYFDHTKHVAGVADARFQSLMPDAYHWLGIKKIDELVSMSGEKYNALINAGIEISQRIEIPDRLIPTRAGIVEMTAKTSIGGYYHTHGEICAADLIHG